MRRRERWTGLSWTARLAGDTNQVRYEPIRKPRTPGQNEDPARLILETVFATARVHIRCRTPSLVFARVRTNLR